MQAKPCRTSKRARPVIFIVAALLAIVAISADATLAKGNPKYAGIVVDAKSGKTLYASNADARRYPASLTKIMTLYILFEEIEAGRLNQNSRLKVSKRAAAQPPTKLGLKPGSTIKVRDAMRALAVKSANDVAVVVAENISGSEPAFARRMTRTARSLGMKSTTFRNASGLPDSKQVTTARDMSRLGRAVEQRFPGHYKIFSTRVFSWGKNKYRNHNRLLGRVKGVDGIKTGYTRASGFNLVTSVRHSNRHTVSVVLGGRTSKRRNAHMQDLISRYHRKAKRGSATAPLLVSAAPRTPSLPRSRPQNMIMTASTRPKNLQRPILAVNRPVELATAAAGPALHKPVIIIPKPADTIAARIRAASEVADLAYTDGEGDGDTLPAQISRIAQLRYPSTAHRTEPVVNQNLNDKTVQPNSANRDGWHIQVAAVPSESAAQSILRNIQARAGGLLVSADPFTQPVNTNGVRLYRARFAGFSGKTEARSICRKLKKKSVTCLAVPG